jgi:hypothetical protein
MSDVELCLTPKQAEFFLAQEPQAAFIGGRGSGKTFVGARVAGRLALEFPGTLGLITANTHDQMIKNTLPPFFQFLDSIGVDYVFGSTPEFGYPSRFQGALAHHGVISISNGAQIVCRGLENYDTIRGAEYGWWWGDETRDTDPIAYKTALACMRDKNGPLWVRFTSTPNGLDWLYEEFHDKPINDASLHGLRRMVKASTYDNAGNLPDGFIELIESSYDKDFARQEIYGEFINLGTSTVYSCFSRALHVRDDIRIEPNLPLCLGADFNVSPMAWIVGQHQSRGDVVVDEIWRERPREGLSAVDSAALDFCDRYSKHVGGIRIYCDATGDGRHVATTETAYKRLVEVIRSKCSNVTLHKPDSNPPVVDRVACVNARLRNMKGGISLFVSRKCQYLIRDFEQVTWKKAGELNSGPKKDLTHISDACGYWQFRVYSFGKPVGFGTNQPNRAMTTALNGIFPAK